MATLREYFDTDFAYAARVHVRLPASGADTEVAVLYDFSAYTAFLACYVSGDQHNLQSFLQLVEALRPGIAVVLDGKVTLSSARTFPGLLQVRNTNPFVLRARFHGNPEWMSTDEIPTSTRIFIYSESRLTDSEILQLQQKGRDLAQSVQFRSVDHAEARSQSESPLAFISHDSPGQGSCKADSDRAAAIAMPGLV